MTVAYIYIYIAIIIMCSGARRKAMVTYLRGVAIKNVGILALFWIHL